MVAALRNHHRTSVVRPEARVSLLAYAYLRGMPYRRVEADAKRKPDWSRVASIAKRFGELDPVAFEAWSKAE